MTVAVAVAAIGAAVGVWLWQGGGGTGSAAQDGLPANRDLPELPFPDPDSFGYGDGPDAMCAALDEVMIARCYLHVSGIVIRAKDYPKTGNIVAAEELAGDLQGLLKRSECGPLYRPFADTGYAVYCEPGVHAGFVVDETTYVNVDTSGSVVVDGGYLVGLSEDVATGDMIALLTAMGG